MDLGFRLYYVSSKVDQILVSILGLMDLGFRLKEDEKKGVIAMCFNPWFNGFRF